MTASTPVVATTGHVGLNVTDLTRSLGFYQSVFGLDVLGQGQDPDRRWAFLGRDGQLVLTLWQQSTGSFSVTGPGLHHLSFEVPDMAAVEHAVSVLQSLRVPMIYDDILPHA